MPTNAASKDQPAPTSGNTPDYPSNIVETAQHVAPKLAERAADIDQNDRFVGQNYALLKEAGLVEAGVPRELGGRGAEIAELAEMLRVLARACGSTALAFSMHTHQVAIPAWRWRHQQVTAVEPLLKRVAAERIVLLSSGGSDWIGGSGKAEKVEGGYRITARKVFTSGAEAGSILMTGAIHEGEDGSRSVIHFGVPMKADEVHIEDTWRTLGMRGTASNDVVIKNLFIPDANVAFSRKAGEWHPVFQTIATIAFPLIYAVYLGVAESARDIAVGIAKSKPEPDLSLAGRMETELRAAQVAHRWMLDIVARNAPSADSVNEVMIGRSLVARHAIMAVELAMELAGGASFYRKTGLERCFRDVQGARFHPLQAGPQARYAGAMALGLPTTAVF
ncbi:MAG: acyl-CoA dehydrogenase [Mesorhizobium sp.]|uniref:acyl-CoA dehydrogenase family protein n=1 Tax=Mesorhizobium sp. TaxID=1871066 RepID=UPI000FE9181A|nr:acyl-CoA dehydrogenase family protein [Mesorhizobium sp.]RWM15206.1 MAG: acyl-CoA dehydrogenase [Mesorhizobium sp.]TIP74033.1 MAG: acyl-CoA dehydrogenase [Mesorhizobium sp.]TIQ14383.1 MAG: acyl-CoA dehydrogenase [Mesorhizobium sp.]TIR52460.1 MAG: acyl-CoA dehydrogenase [Mesorhizobium sp.]TJV95808.1 MAG: acyl-CoA dehydrogenase [Mesorhizobium sp.]